MDWKPQAKQEVALSRIEDEILFGGARGGGKTDTGQAWLLYDVDKPYYRALVIRRNATDLDDWIDRARTMYARCGAKYTGSTFTFPSGAKIRTGHLKDDNAFSKYQGHEYQKMLIEELTQISNENDYEKLRASCRSKYPDIKPQIFATTNPDGAGHKWVKVRWNIPDNPKEIVTQISAYGMTRVFIPSTIEDNKILVENDPLYVKQLDSIQDEDLKRAWRFGSWEGFGIQGAYYRTQIQKAIEENRITNVPHSAGLPVITWWDLGVGDSTSIGFFQQVGNEWHMIDYYEATGEGLAHYVSVLQRKQYVYSEHYAPHDIQVRELGSGKSRLEMAQSLGLNFSVAPKLSIDDGINAVRTRFNTLWIDKENCKKFIECIKNYQKEWNDKMGEFKAAPLHDWSSHAADMLRYWAVTNYAPDDSMIWKVSRNRMNKATMQ